MAKLKLPKKVIGWKEYIALPALGIDKIKAKVDTGATTSSLHAEDIKEFKRGQKTFVRFSLRLPGRKNRRFIEARLVDKRRIRSSNGESEFRYVILSTAELLDKEWLIELTLTDRSLMRFDMLLGRNALSKHFVVDTAKSFVGLKK